MVRGEHAACADLNARLLAIAEGSTDPELALMAHDTIGQTLVYTGRPREAREHLDRAVALYQPGSNLADRYGGEDPGVATYGFLAIAHWLLGDSEAALASATRAQEIAESLANPHSMALALNQIAEVHFLRRDVDAARAATVPMLEIAEQQGFPYYLPTAQVLHGWVVAQDGELDRALALITTGIEGLERLGARLERPVCCLLLAEVHLAAGRPQVAINVLDEALGLIEVTGERCFESELLRLKAQALGPGETAPRLLEEALAIAREQGAVALEERVGEALAGV
jgi:predicted ATPase